MKKNNGRGPLLDHIDSIEAQCSKGDPTLQNIIDIFGSQGHFVLITFLTIPFLQPIPIPAISTIFGCMMAFISVLAFLGKPPWIPERWAHKKIPAKSVLLIAEGFEKVFVKVSFLLHPRWKFFFRGPYRLINTILISVNAILLALPLFVPLSNTLPTLVVLFQALAHLEDDGLFIILSYIQTIISFSYFIFLAWGIGSGLEWLGF